ncbi:MAG: bifunctional demethylmenaquinone methyltransferase/2-methoxy-6-polyprenyl-1,4-benzoquinol methylase UbiE [Deltaproteobacteria bacterium]|nr:bifunctional demethylmenaquinone methyltransferase/2-methoxy-6-polyprenyl-1,4-benzoquinol methylase UbiE [Deltaproteobacteria bacterium]
MNNMELGFVRDMFEAIAPRYDFLNRLLSLRQDIVWRRNMVKVMKIPVNGRVLDAACGTGDVAIEINRQKGPEAYVTGIDFSPGMLRLGKSKIQSAIKGNRVELLAADAFDLPFKPDTFDAVTIAFGIRNIADKLSVLKIFHDRLKRGGMLLVLELSTPKKGLMLDLYMFYFKKILPQIGWFISKNLKAYQYLPASVLNFPSAVEFAAIMSRAGFCDVQWKKMTMGIVTLYRGLRGEDSR